MMKVMKTRRHLELLMMVMTSKMMQNRIGMEVSPSTLTIYVENSNKRSAKIQAILTMI
jgi:hypothetical protein